MQGSPPLILAENLVTLEAFDGVRIDVNKWLEFAIILPTCFFFYFIYFETQTGQRFQQNAKYHGYGKAFGMIFAGTKTKDDDEFSAAPTKSKKAKSPRKADKAGSKATAGGSSGGGKALKLFAICTILVLLSGMFCFRPPVPKTAEQVEDDAGDEGASGWSDNRDTSHADDIEEQSAAEKAAEAAAEAKSLAEAEAAEKAQREAVAAKGGSTECQVCVHVIDGFVGLIKKKENRKKMGKVGKALTRYCKNAKSGKEKKMCYIFDPIKKMVAQPLASGHDPLKVCKKLSQNNPEVCEVKF